MKTIYVGSFNHLNKGHGFITIGLPSTLLSTPSTLLSTPSTLPSTPYNSVDKIRVRVRKYYPHQNTNQEKPLHLGISQSVIRIRHRGIIQDKNQFLSKQQTLYKTPISILFYF